MLLLLGFGGAWRGILAQALAEFLAHLGAAGHYLYVEPEEVAHLVERGFQDVEGFHLGRTGKGFHQFGVVGRLHGDAVEFPLDGAQVFGDAQNAEVNLLHAFPVLAVHGVLSNRCELVPSLRGWFAFAALPGTQVPGSHVSPVRG